METTRRQAARKVGREALDELMGEVCGGEGHAQRVASLSDGGDGVLPAASLGVRAMGHGLAVAHGLAPRQAITQVDRLLSNPKLLREEVARGWTECEDSDQSMIVLGTQTEHGRSTPLVWKTVTHAALQDQRHAPEDELLGRLAEVLPKGGRVTVVADRGGSDITRYRCLKALGVESIMRVRGVVDVASADGERRQATDWLGAGGQRRVLRGARVTAEGQPVPLVVCVPQKRMQEPWWLASRRSDLTGTAIKDRSSTRFMVEETCRDVKNPRLGLGLTPTVMARHDRRDALFRLAVRAHTRLTRLGTAGEELGRDRWLGATRPRPDSHFRQGQMRFGLIPTMDQPRLRILLQRFGQLLRAHTLLSQVLGDR
jgi:hypothetical protein